MRIYDLKIEQCRSNFKDTKHKIEVTKSKQETAYIPCTSFQRILDTEIRKLNWLEERLWF